MQFADFHLHSKYSRACSKDLDLKNLEKWGRIKGLDIIGSSDFTHPKWIQELKSGLKEDPEMKGIYTTNAGFKFVLSTELSFVYTDNAKGRRVHLVVLAPNFDVVDQITEYLLKHGRIDYDGRPIFKIPCDNFAYEMNKISDEIEIIPAHCLTPWFGIFGENSDYDTMEDCFKDQAKLIHALETGMSADPAMIYRVADWRKYSLVSNSDSHSFWPWRIGREATIFDMKKISYKNFINAIRNKELAGTVEVDPGYGKYHFTGHRNCHVVMNPVDGKRINNICPSCKTKMTVGVSARVEELADKPEGYYPKDAPKFYSLVPLSDMISGYYKTGVSSKKTWEIYNRYIATFHNEFNVLLNADQESLMKVDAQLAKLILSNREGKIKVMPGFDGVYGAPLIHGDEQYDYAAAGTNDENSKKSAKNNEMENHVKKSALSKEQSSLGKFF